MSQEGRQPKLLRWVILFRLLLITFGCLVVLGLLFPAIPMGCPPINPKTRAKNDATQLVTAIKAYQTEYGRYPPSERGMFLDEASQAALLRVLQAIDPKHAYNPRRVYFFDALLAHSKRDGWFKPKYYYGGIHPHSGALLDPWGRPYRILLDDDYDNKIQSPYTDVAELRTPVAVWSLGKDGVQGSPGKDNILKDSDDVTSWR